MERFFRNLKRDRSGDIAKRIIMRHSKASQVIFLDVYNCKRLHSTLKYLSLNAFEARMRDTQTSNEVATYMGAITLSM